MNPQNNLHKVLVFCGKVVQSRRENLIIRNTYYSVLELALPFLFTVVFTPFFLSTMHAEGYGLWNVALAFMGLIGVFDFGLGTSVTKFGAEYISKKDRQGFSAVVTISVVLNLVLGIIFTLALYLSSSSLANLFVSSEISTTQISYVIRLCALGLFPLILQNVSLAIPRGLQDFKFPAYLLIAQNVFITLLAATILLMSGTVTQVILGTVISIWGFSFISSFAAFISLRRFGSQVVFSSGVFSRLLKYTVLMGLTGLGIKVFNLLDRIVVAQVLGFTAAAYYVIATGVATKFTALGSATTQALLPAFSSWGVSQDKRHIWQFIKKSTAVVGGISILIGGVLILISRPLLYMWLGEVGVRVILTPMRIMIFIYMIKTIAAPAYQAANGLGFPGVTALATMTAGLGTIGLIILLGRHYYLIGASWANIASWSLFAIVLYMFRKLNPKLEVTRV